MAHRRRAPGLKPFIVARPNAGLKAGSSTRNILPIHSSQRLCRLNRPKRHRGRAALQGRVKALPRRGPLGPVVARVAPPPPTKTEQFRRDRAPTLPNNSRSTILEWSAHSLSPRSPLREKRCFNTLPPPRSSSKPSSTIAPKADTVCTISS